ncbi:MAG: magnesium transporter [Ardenticatenales bacterium]|nr:magnesium transporter [Ardenticatenales bacterium]
MSDEITPTYDDLQNLIERLQDGETGAEINALLAELHPADWADIIEELPPKARIQLLRALPVEDAAEVLEYIEDEETVAIADQMALEELAAILDEMAPDAAADLLGDLDPARVEALLAEMDEEDAVRPLLAFPDDTAGGLMVPLPFSLRSDMTVAAALDALRESSPDAELIYYLFVVDQKQRLVGVVSLRRLVVATPETRIATIMDDEVLTVSVLTDQEECGRLLQRYGLMALPVVDESMRLVGFITHDDLVEVVAEEVEEDTLHLGGLSSESEVFDSLGGAIRKRLPWLYVNLGTAFLAASVVSYFEPTIARFAVLAVFQSIVAGQGGNAGTQTLTLMVRGLATQELGLRDAVDLLRRESTIGLMQGTAVGIGVGIVAYLWKGNLLISLILCAAMMGNMVVANTAGVMIPLLLERAGVDPAVASGVFVTALTDICGFTLFLGMATLLLP